MRGLANNTIVHVLPMLVLAEIREPGKRESMPPDRDDDNAAEPTAEDMIDAALDYEAQQRLWLRAIGELVSKRRPSSDPSDRVQFALDQVFIAACERGVRILGSDLPK